jgi:hypothetical protein
VIQAAHTEHVADQEDVFARLHLTGGRFQGIGMPVEALAELVAYQRLIVGVAEEIFFSEHPGRQRLPRGFAERLQLRLRTVERGSVVPVLERMREPGTLQMPLADEFARSRDLIEEAVAAIAAEDPLPEAFPRKAVVLFNQFGRTLQPDEAIELRRGTAARGPRYTSDVRRRLVLGQRHTFQAEASDIGRVLEIDSYKMTCLIRLRSTLEAHSVPAPVDEFTFDQLKAVMEPNGDGPPVRITGIGVYSTAGVLRRFESIQDVSPVEAPEELDALDSRIAELGELQHGWLDGEGVPPALAALKNASFVLAELLRLDVPRPRLYPAVEGGVQAEWTVGNHEVSVTFEPDGSFYALAVNRDSGESYEVENGDAEEIAELILQSS